MPTKKPDPYHAYLLRCWQEQAATPDEPAIWRFALQEVSGEQTQWAFQSLEEVMAFLQIALNELEDIETQDTMKIRGESEANQSLV